MQAIRRCGKYLRRHRALLLAYSLLAIASRALGLGAALATGRLLGLIADAAGPGPAVRYCGVLACLTLASLGLGYAVTRIYVRLQMSMGAAYNLDVLRHLQSVPLSCLEGRDIASLNQQINTDTNGLVIFCLGLANSLPVNILTLGLVFAVCFSIDGLIALLLLLYCLLYALAYALARKKSFRTAYAQLEASNRFFSALFEQLDRIGFIRAQGAEEYFRSRTAEPLRALYASTVESQRFAWLLGGIDMLLTLLCQLTLCLFGALRMSGGGSAIGGFVVFSAYFASALSSIRYFFSLGTSYQQARVSCERLARLEALPEEDGGGLAPGRIGSVRVEGLSFSYGERRVFTDFSAAFEGGGLHAVAGCNGSGKTTLTRLLLGLYAENITGGTVCAGGVSLSGLRMVAYRQKSVAYSEQEPVLFPGSVKDNIMLGDDDPDRWARAVELLRLFDADWLLHTPRGPDSCLPEGLSGGEKQKLSLVRALSKNADVVILDEPTAALDTQSSKTLLEYLKGICMDKIVILITHDAGTISSCDHVLQMDALSRA